MINTNNSLPEKLKKLNISLTLKNACDNNMVKERKSLNEKVLFVLWSNPGHFFIFI